MLCSQSSMTASTLKDCITKCSVYGPTFTATRRNEMVHWDYLQLGDGFGGDRYALVVKDGLSHYCELFACSSANSDVAADALLSWYKRYGCPEKMMSDQGSHFRNETPRILCSRLKIEQQFSPVYSPWVNGTVERLNRDVLQVLRVMLMEYHLDQHEWTYLLPVIQANLNQTPVRSLAGKCPMELFLALPPPSALDVITRPGRNDSITTIDLTRVEDSLDKVGSSLRLARNKLLAQWVGPFVVIEARPHSFMIRHLLTGATYEVHGSRLRFYADSSLDVTEEIREFVSNQGMLLGVDGFADFRYKRWELLVNWTGLQDIEASWEPL
ncbi:unnamed protein product [Phytophthora fragariaefolia]|uniref:Unnamed protein product n=1 Tax=Phytophthora fragariaefolia TaxID=1490495 RepID=A0A9W7D082_9STRA|nr:unnamed protein product [Phytophthora fragariaefolia]